MSTQATGLVTGDVFRDIKKFHEKYGFFPRHLTATQIVNRLQFLEEELLETEKAAYDMNAEEVIDGLVDLIVVAAGTLYLMGDVGRSAWGKVMAKNNEKVIGFNPKRPNSEGVDLVKPAGWTSPDLADEAQFLNETFMEIDGANGEEEFRRMLADNSHLSGEKLLRILGNFKDLSANVKAFNEVVDRELSQSVGGDSPLSDKEAELLLKEIYKRPAVRILEDAADVIRAKSEDYQNPDSTVKAADYYPNGLDDFVYMIDVLKRNRMTSLLETLKKRGETYSPNNEDLRDTLIDRINYLALMVEWLDGDMDGQDPLADKFNRRTDAATA